MTSYTKNFVTDYSPPLDGVTDCSGEWADFYNFLQGLNAGDDVTLTVPNAGAGGANTYVMDGPGGFRLVDGLLGGLTVVVNATGVTFTATDGGIAAGFNVAGIGVVEDDPTKQALIESASIGATSVRLKTPSEHTRFVVNQWICVAGFDLQGGGSSPPNPAFHDYRKITAINTSTGDISFSTGLANQYLSTWPSYSTGQPVATIYAMPYVWDLDLTINGLTIDQVNVQTYCKARKYTWNGGGALGGNGLIPSQCDEINWIDFDQSSANQEVDKLVTTLNITRGDYRIFQFISMTGPANMFVTDAHVDAYNGTPRRLTIDGGTTDSLSIGVSGYGRTDQISVTDCIIGEIAINPVVEPGGPLGVDSKYTISGGVISYEDDGVPLAWAVPGTNLVFRGQYTFEGSPFQVTGVTQDSGFTRVHTTLPGGWPTLPFFAGTSSFKLVVHPCPILSGTGNTGCADAVDLSQAGAQNKPLWSYSRRTYNGSSPAVVVPVWGYLVSIRIEVVTPYTGSSSPTFGFDGPFVINSAGSAVIWTPTIDPKQAGVRNLYPTTHDGTQAGDSITDPGAGTWLLNDQMYPRFSSVPGDIGSTSITVEVITDQGLDARDHLMGAVFFPGIRCLAPAITSDGGGATAAVSVAGGEIEVTTVVAEQAHGGGPINYSITGGADAALFEILDQTGDLWFIDPAEAGEYEVEVAATGRGGGSDTQTITVTVTGGGAYEGPLDIVSGAILAYGQRALSAAMRGSALYTIREDAGDTTQEFSSDATTGAAPAASILAFLDGAAGLVVTDNDQSGNDIDTTQADPDAQPAWAASVQNSQPGIVAFDGRELSGNVDFAGGALTIIAVAKVTDPSNGYALLHATSSQINFGSFWNVAGDLYFDTGGGMVWATTETVDVGAHVFECVVAADGATTISVDGVALTTTLQSGIQAPLEAAPTAVVKYPGTGAGVTQLECVAWNAAVSSDDRTSIRENMADYYGITVTLHWILTDGSWDDSGSWDDTAVWID
jgi:hypothetical protein